MARTTADVLADRLLDWGVRVVFGIPGDGINGIIEALRTRQDRIAFVQVRHEESAAFMACAYAKYSGRLGVCLATSGPGAIHLLNGLYDAKMDGAPVLALTGQTYHDPDRHALPAGSRSAVAVQGRRGLQPADPRRRPHAGARRRRLPRRPLAERRRAPFLPGRLSGSTGRQRSAVREKCRGTHIRRLAAADRGAVRRRGALRGGRAERGHEDRHPRRPGRAGRPRRARTARRSDGRADREAAARQGHRAGRLAVHHRRHRPARHRAVGGGDGTGRHAADGRHELPVHGVLPETRSLPRRADRSRSVAHRPALPGRGRACAATRRRRCRY